MLMVHSAYRAGRNTCCVEGEHRGGAQGGSRKASEKRLHLNQALKDARIPSSRGGHRNGFACAPGS